MTNDNNYAIIILVLFVATVSSGGFSRPILELLMKLTRPGATVILLSSVALMSSRGLLYTSLSMALISVYLLKDLWKTWPESYDRQVQIDIGKDQARFNYNTSVDLQWASKSVKHDSPNMLFKDQSAGPLLIYPPSEATLHSMCG
jgi:hypothetical protein